MDTLPILTLNTWVDFFLINWFPVTLISVAGICMQWLMLRLSRAVAGAEDERRAVFHRTYSFFGGLNAALFVFLIQFAWFSFSFRPLTLLIAGLVMAFLASRNLLLNLIAGLWVSLSKSVRRGDLVEVAGKLGVYHNTGVQQFQIKKDVVTLSYPNRFLLLPLFYNLRQEPIISVPFEIDVPREVNLDEARKAITKYFAGISFVLEAAEESVVKSIKPGSAYHLHLQVKTYGSQVWAVCGELHNELSLLLEDMRRKEPSRAYNWQIK